MTNEQAAKATLVADAWHDIVCSLYDEMRPLFRSERDMVSAITASLAHCLVPIVLEKWGDGALDTIEAIAANVADDMRARRHAGAGA